MENLELAIENLEREHKELRQDIIDVSRMLRKKHKLLGELMNISKKRLVGPGTLSMMVKKEEETTKKRKYFPLRNQKELDEFEQTIALDESQHKDIIREVKQCIKSFGLKRSFCNIVNPQVVAYYNLKGTLNQKRLLDYPNFLNLLYRAVEDKGTTYDEFIFQIRKAITVARSKCPNPILLTNLN